jgi:hypothetical protein
VTRAFFLAVAIVATWASPALSRDPIAEDDPPAPPPTAPADPAPYVAPPPGIYYVTDTYVADSVTSTGPLTTYATVTVHESTGSYARVLDVVATGEPSVYDGKSFNRRLLLADGRAVAGTYYQNYVLAADAFVAVSIVFFQDDAELRTGAPSITRPRTVRPAVSLAPSGPVVTNIEILRGRPVMLWLRAFADDREIPMRGWRLVSGEAGEPAALRGGVSDPFATSWDRLPPPGSAYLLVFEVEAEDALTAVAVSVTVRSPALER